MYVRLGTVSGRNDCYYRRRMFSRWCRSGARRFVRVFLHDQEQDGKSEQKCRKSGQKLVAQRGRKPAVPLLGWGPCGSVFLQVEEGFTPAANQTRWARGLSIKK